MKKITVLLLGITLSLAATAQRVQSDIQHSFNKQTGVNLYKVTKTGFVYGVGGSYLFSTYTGATGGKYQELANTYLGNDGDRLSNALRNNYNVTSFKEDRGTVKALLGYSFRNTAVYSNVGMAFRSQYWKGVGYDAMPGFTSPNKDFYIYKNIAPRFLYGLTVSQLIVNRWGVNIGWDNVSGVQYGIAYKITPTEWFNYE